jgi:hypothetical protein
VRIERREQPVERGVLEAMDRLVAVEVEVSAGELEDLL